MKRVRELIEAVRLAHPKDRFFDRFVESCRENPGKRKAYRTYDDAFRVLDPISWQVLKQKAIAHFRDHRKGQLKQGFFNQLNEAFAYRHLVRQGYRNVELLRESGHPVPDLRYNNGRTLRHCEVKTLNISDVEIERRGSMKAFLNAYVTLDDGFFGKLRGAVTASSSPDCEPRDWRSCLSRGDLGRHCSRLLLAVPKRLGRCCQS
jgi:hypothetical protein